LLSHSSRLVNFPSQSQIAHYSDKVVYLFPGLRATELIGLDTAFCGAMSKVDKGLEAEVGFADLQDLGCIAY